MYDYLDLEGCIKIYAQLIADDIHEGRGEVHMRLCDLLGVSKDEFRPFEYDLGGESIGNAKRAEWTIRRAIHRLNKKEVS